MLIELLKLLYYAIVGLATLFGFAMLWTILEYELSKPESIKQYERRLHQEAIEREDRLAQRKAS